MAKYEWHTDVIRAAQEQPVKQSTMFDLGESIDACRHESTEVQPTLFGSTDRVCTNCGSRVN